MIEKTMPRVQTATRIGPTVVGIKWRDGASDRIDLAGWIATGGEVLAPLNEQDVFAQPLVGDYGASVFWGDEDGDLSIDAMHLKMLADEQRKFSAADIAAWQKAMHLSNQEAADFLQVSLSTWNAYKAGGAVPASIGMLCRAAQRDPILMQAHYRPRKTGRPRKSA